MEATSWGKAFEALSEATGDGGLLSVILAGAAILLLLKLVGVAIRISSRLATWGLLAAIIAGLVILYRHSQQGPENQAVQDPFPTWTSYGADPYGH